MGRTTGTGVTNDTAAVAGRGVFLSTMALQAQHLFAKPTVCDGCVIPTPGIALQGIWLKANAKEVGFVMRGK